NSINKSSFYKSSDISTELADNPVDYTRKLVETLIALMDPHKFDIKKTITSRGDNIIEYMYEAIPKKNAKIVTKVARITIVIDESVGLLKELKIYADNSNSIVDIAGTFDYPEFGPLSIYDIGAPADAKVVDNTSDQQLLELCDKYEKARDSFLDKRVTVIDNGRKEYTIMYSDGDRFRFDTITAYDPHILLGPEEAINNIIYRGNQVYNNEYFDKLQKELFGIKFCVCKSEIYKDQIHYSLEYETPDNDDLANGKWRIEEKENYKVNKESDIYNSFILSLSCWPNGILEEGFHRTKASIISDIYSEKHSLICIELLSDGWGYEGRIGRLPERVLYYIDPNKDYLCHRTVRQVIRDAWWQVDTNWLDGLENINNEQDRQTITEVVEYGQTSAGQWYPQKRSATTEIDNYDCQTEYKLDRGSSITIYENPVFEDDFFDPELILEKQKP
ncbi:MAG: hypothetical protein JW745_03015, partial [Sedimentisphaerales bacterium]|nr:hypothetical protein [Sedimentisphaerales bacterium]